MMLFQQAIGATDNWPDITSMMDYFSSNVGSIQLSVPRVAPQVGGYAGDTSVADTTYVRIPSNIIQEGISPAILPRGFYDYTPSILLRGLFT
jgi:hypothetical protein